MVLRLAIDETKSALRSGEGASRAIRQAEVGAAKTMIERTQERFDLKPEYLAADTAYGSAAMLNWVVNEQEIAPHIPVIDKSQREDGTFSREDFRFDAEQNIYICRPARYCTPPERCTTAICLAIVPPNSIVCTLKMQCCPNMPVARALAKTEAFERSRHYRNRVEMLFAHLKRILRLGRLRLRGPCGAQDEFTLAAIAQNLRRLAKLVVRPPPPADACLA